jgi:glycerophosphoryl diester phosphodiesterase
MFSWLHPSHTPLIVAHRGSSAIAPENTLAAFRRAIDDGADAIELDVRLSKDGEVIVIHDSQLQRTTDGRGLVRNHTWKELQLLSAGSWFHQKFSSEKISTLEDVLDVIDDRIGVNIEIKTDRLDRRKLEVVNRCCRIIQQSRVQQSILVSSFEYEFLRRVRILQPQLAIGVLAHPIKYLGRLPLQRAKALNARYIVVNGATLRKRFVKNAHEYCSIAEYTVNSPRRLQRALRYGVDAIITNHPHRIISLLGRS